MTFEVRIGDMPPLVGRRRFKSLRDAMAQADRKGGRVLDGWTVVYQSSKDRKRNGRATGGGGSMERVEVDPSHLWMEPPADWIDG